MTPGESYTEGTLVRVRGVAVLRDRRRVPFCAGIVIHPVTRRACWAAPILHHYLGTHEDKLRQSFRRLGFTATVAR